MTEAPQPQLNGAEDVLWDLSIFYDGLSDPRIESDLAQLDASANAFAEQYRGRVQALSADELHRAVATLETLSDQLYRVFAFAHLSYATDSNSPDYGAFLQRVTEYGATFSQTLMFFSLEWQAVPDEHVTQLLDDPAIGKYRHYLEAERRFKPHILTEAEEKILVESSVNGRSAWVRFFTQLTGSLTCVVDGEEKLFTLALADIKSADRELRRKTAAAITETLRAKRMELTFIFNVLAADKAAIDRLRQYPSWVSSRNLDNKAPDAVVEALVETVTRNYDLVARHYHLKRVLLGYDELFDYDRYAPLVLDAQASSAFYTWEQARQIVIEAFGAFSPEMAQIADRFFAEHWIHAPVVAGKRGGAFSASCTPSSHPFVLVNFTGKTSDISTLAHELGHGVHQYLANSAQGLFGADTPLTTAEMASVFGEMLVFQDLIQREPSRHTQLAMLFEKVEDTFATVFRQTSMNRFEHALHTARREEGELSTERINALWMQTQQAMFGDSVTIGEGYAQWWSYIPHFLHTPGYVYAYAFGELLVLALFNLYRERGADFVPQYMEVLSSGGNDYPDRILAKVGVDLNDPTFWQKGMDAIRALIDQEEELAKALYPEKFA